MNNQKIYDVIMWQDSDVPEMIQDLAYKGKLASMQTNDSDKENQTDKSSKSKSSTNTLTKRKKLTKKQIEKQASQNNDNEASSMLLLSKEYASRLQINNNGYSTFDATTAQFNSNAVLLKTLSNHFAIGNQNAGAADSLVSNKTSNNKLDQSMRITYVEMCARLKTYASKHDETIERLNDFYEDAYFSEWFDRINAGFNILLHGVGSKKGLIDKFCECYLQDNYYLVVLGYHHDFNIKALFKNIISDVLELDEKLYKTSDEQINIINSHLNTNLYLIIHNIDGNCLRDSSTQNCLSELASNSFIHFLASADHINLPLLWNSTQHVSFKWINYEVNTLRPYNSEIMFENSLMLGQAGNVQLSSLIHVLKSLTPNAKNIFYIMVKHILNPDNVKKNIPFSTLYHECREKFLVSNEMTLRAQLTEFIDHKLLKLKPEANGQEAIYLFVDDKNLKLYMEDLKDKV